VRVESGLLNIETEQYAGQGQEGMHIGHLAAAARKLEELGFDGTTMPEAGHDPFLPLVVAAEHTQRIALATNVAIAFPRSPLITAQLAWDLQQLSGGRFQLGLGTQVKGHNERRYCAPWTGAPGPRLREYVQTLRAMFEAFQHGGKAKFEGEHYRFTLMPPFFNPGPITHAHVPIYLAVVNKYMARLAGELCEGVRLHPIATFSYTRAVVMPQIEAGARKAGRSLQDIDLVGAPFLALGRNAEDLAKAKQDAKQRIAFYASTRTYHSVLEHHGWADVGLQLHDMSLKGKWQEMPGLITDEMLDEWAIVATYDDFVPTMRKRCGNLFTTVTVELPVPMRKDAALTRDVVAALQRVP